MATPHHGRHGSMGFYPRKRARSIVPHIDSYPEIDEGPRIQGFAGYKVGMTHVLITDWRKKSNTSGQEIFMPVTVVEVPPIGVAGMRLYKKTTYGLQIYREFWTEKVDKEIFRKIPKIKNIREIKIEEIDIASVEEVRLIVYTKPYRISGVPKKRPEIFELRVGGGKIEDRIKYAIDKMGKELNFKDFSRAGKLVDVIAVTKGKGFQGSIKRFGIKLLHHKNRKHRRLVGTLGPWHPNWVMYTVPMAGQMGFQQRTEYNKRILRVVLPDENGKLKEEILPKGGFLHYGKITGGYLMIHGSIPGSSKRLVRFRDPIRPTSANIEENEIKVSYISMESKQGV